MNPISSNSEKLMFIHFFTSLEKVKSRYSVYKLVSKQNSLPKLLSNVNYYSPDMAWDQIWHGPGSDLQRQLEDGLLASERRRPYQLVSVPENGSLHRLLG